MNTRNGVSPILELVELFLLFTIVLPLLGGRPFFYYISVDLNRFIYLIFIRQKLFFCMTAFIGCRNFGSFAEERALLDLFCAFGAFSIFTFLALAWFLKSATFVLASPQQNLRPSLSARCKPIAVSWLSLSLLINLVVLNANDMFLLCRRYKWRLFFDCGLVLISSFYCSVLFPLGARLLLRFRLYL